MRIPETIDEAILETIRILQEEDQIVEAYNMSEVECRVNLHYTVGKRIRRDWGFLAHQGELYWYFRSIGIWHADDMSSIVITSTWRKMHQVDINIEGQAKFIIDFWMREECEME